MNNENDQILTWSGEAWNVTTGCTKISEGCANCYAERQALQMQKEKSYWYKNGFQLTLHHSRLRKPIEWKRPRRIFVCSMSDLFHKNIPDEFIQEVFNVMNKASHHQFMVLIKRSERMLQIAPLLNWSKNIAVGVTVETE